MTQLTTYNIDKWLESWARWCHRDGLSKILSPMDFKAASLGSIGGGSSGEYDEIEMKVEVAICKLAVLDETAAAALRMDFNSRKSQSDKADLIGVSISTYRRKIIKAKHFILENVNK